MRESPRIRTPAEIFVNPMRQPPAPSEDRCPSAQVLAFHQRLPEYAVTPLVEAAGLAGELGLERLWVKVESNRLGLPAFKMLGASWATYRAVLRRMGLDVADGEPAWRTVDDLRSLVAEVGTLTLVAATDGNHGRAVARMARLLG